MSMWQSLSILKDSVSTLVSELNDVDQVDQSPHDEHKAINHTSGQQQDEQQHDPDTIIQYLQQQLDLQTAANDTLRDNFQKLIQDQEQEINRLNNVLKSNTENQTEQDTIQEDKHENQLLRKELDDLNIQLMDQSSQHSEEIQNLQNIISKQNQENNTLHKNLEQIQKLYSELKQVISAQENQESTDADTHKPSVSLITHQEVLAQLGAVRAENDELLQRISTTTSEMHKFRETIGLSIMKKDMQFPELLAQLLSDWNSEKSRMQSEKGQVKDLMLEIDDLRKSEARLISNGKKQEEQYNTLLEQLKKLQADCRDAFSREEGIKVDFARIQVDLKRSREQCASLDAQLRDSKSFEENLNRQLSLVRGDLSNKQAVLDNLTKQMESRIAEWVSKENDYEQEIQRLNRELGTISEELQQLRRSAVEQESSVQQDLADQSAKISELESIIEQYEMDREAAESLAQDYRQLKEDFTAKNGECVANLQALSNLQMVMEKLQNDFNAERNVLQTELAEHKKYSGLGQSALKQLEELQEQISNRDTTIAELRKELKSSRKYTVKLETDNGELRRTLQATLSRLDNFSSDVNLVDRRLVTQLLVAYVEGKRSRKELVELMSKILQFTDEEKQRVGLGGSITSTVGGFGSWVSSFVSAGPSRGVTSAGSGSSMSLEDGKNLGDLWVDFLLSESDPAQARRDAESKSEAVRAVSLGVELSESEEADDVKHTS